MARPSTINDKRRRLLPVLARAFAELGYRKATTATLAKRCGVQENVLYRMWPDKRTMFLSAIEFTYDFSEQTWVRLLNDGRKCSGSPARRLLDFEAKHHGEFGHYRIAFMALAESDDPEIREALRRMYARFHRFLCAQIVVHRHGPAAGLLPADVTAWAAIGLGTVANIGRAVGLLDEADRQRLLSTAGRQLLEGGNDRDSP